MSEVSKATLCSTELLDSARGIGKEGDTSEDGERARSHIVDSMDVRPTSPVARTRRPVATPTDDQPHLYENSP